MRTTGEDTMMQQGPSRRRAALRAIAIASAVALALAACGDDGDEGGSTTAAGTAADAGATTTAATATSEPTGTEAESTEPTSTEPGGTEPTDTEGSAPETSTEGTGTGEAVSLDTNGDGTVVFGVATPGPRDDGAYYQALVEGVIAFSEEQGFGEPIIVDNIDPAQAETELRNLARQGVDVITVGAGEIADPLATLTEEFADIFWYCNCGAGVENPGLAQAGDDSSEISYTAGYATGLLLQDTDSTSVAFLGCCDLDFEREAFLAFELGLQAVDPAFTVTYIPTGDFNDVAGATEAFNNAVAEGAGAVYPFLGGSHEAVVQLANDNEIITMSAGTSDACEREDLDYQIAVQFSAGDYLDTIFDLILSGELQEGDRYVFRVGEFEKVGAKLCDATPEQEEALEVVRQQIAAGEFEEQFGEIKAEAYGG
jgi:basic membrane protein A